VIAAMDGETGFTSGRSQPRARWTWPRCRNLQPRHSWAFRGHVLAPSNLPDGGGCAHSTKICSTVAGTIRWASPSMVCSIAPGRSTRRKSSNMSSATYNIAATLSAMLCGIGKQYGGATGVHHLLSQHRQPGLTADRSAPLCWRWPASRTPRIPGGRRFRRGTTSRISRSACRTGRFSGRTHARLPTKTRCGRRPLHERAFFMPVLPADRRTPIHRRCRAAVPRVQKVPLHPRVEDSCPTSTTSNGRWPPACRGDEGNGWTIFSLSELLAVLPEKTSVASGVGRVLPRTVRGLPGTPGCDRHVAPGPHPPRFLSRDFLHVDDHLRFSRGGSNTDGLDRPAPYAQAVFKAWEALNKTSIDKGGNIHGVLPWVGILVSPRSTTSKSCSGT